MKKEEIKPKSKTKITKEESYNRSIIACGNYFYPLSPNYLKKVKSCMAAGYGKSQGCENSNKILGLDRLQDSKFIIEKKLDKIGPLTLDIIEQRLKTFQDPTKNVSLRDLNVVARTILEAKGMFVKKEMKLELKKEEKHIYLHFDDPNKEIDYHKEIIALHNERVKELEHTIDVE